MQKSSQKVRKYKRDKIINLPTKYIATTGTRTGAPWVYRSKLNVHDVAKDTLRLRENILQVNDDEPESDHVIVATTRGARQVLHQVYQVVQIILNTNSMRRKEQAEKEEE